MTEFWESSFIEKQMMWGLEPSASAILTKDFFLEKNVKDILIPGIGYHKGIWASWRYYENVKVRPTMFGKNYHDIDGHTIPIQYYNVEKKSSILFNIPL